MEILSLIWNLVEPFKSVVFGIFAGLAAYYGIVYKSKKEARQEMEVEALETIVEIGEERDEISQRVNSATDDELDSMFEVWNTRTE